MREISNVQKKPKKSAVFQNLNHHSDASVVSQTEKLTDQNHILVGKEADRPKTGNTSKVMPKFTASNQVLPTDRTIVIVGPKSRPKTG